MQQCKNIEIFKSVKNNLGAANFKCNKITQNGSKLFFYLATNHETFIYASPLQPSDII